MTRSSIVLVVSLVLMMVFVKGGLSQDNLPVYDEKDIDKLIQYEFGKTVDELSKFLSANSDPYGIQLGIQVSTTPEGAPKGQMYAGLNISDLREIANVLIKEQRFNTYDFEKIPREIQIPGMWKIGVGLSSETVTNNTQEFQVVGNSFSFKCSGNGKMSQVNVQSYAIVIGSTPVDGTIISQLNYYSDGSYPAWSGWDGESPKVAYKRVGPGNKTTNSKRGKDDFRSVSGEKVNIPNVFNPGYYLPIIQFRKCEQDFTNYAQFKEMEAIVKLNKQVSWSDFTYDSSGKAVPSSSLKGENAKGEPINSYFSRKNKVKGTIYDADGNKLDHSVAICLERQFAASFPKKYERDSKADGTYEFPDVESGVYHVFVKDNPDQYEIAEVCNCPQKGEKPNFEYEVDIHAQVDLVFMIECTETYKEDIEPLVLEGTTGKPGLVESKMVGYSVVRIQNKEVVDFFEPEYISNVIGAPAEDKSKVISYSSVKYSFDPANEDEEGWAESRVGKDEFEGSPNVTFFYPEKKLNGKMPNDFKFVFDSLWVYNSLVKKYQDKKWEAFLGAAYIEGKGLDQEVISHNEAQPVSFGELKQLRNNGSITRTQSLELKKGYQTNFVGLGVFSPEHNEFANLLADFMENPDQINSALFPPESYQFLPAEMVQALNSPEAKKGNKSMGVFMRTAYGKNKYSGFFESWASKVKIDRTIRIVPISLEEAEKYLTSGKAFEIRQTQPDLPPDTDQLKEMFKGFIGE